MVDVQSHFLVNGHVSVGTCFWSMGSLFHRSTWSFLLVNDEREVHWYMVQWTNFFQARINIASHILFLVDYAFGNSSHGYKQVEKETFFIDWPELSFEYLTVFPLITTSSWEFLLHHWMVHYATLFHLSLVAASWKIILAVNMLDHWAMFKHWDLPLPVY